jgi:uncharacterized membrane protein YqaE (UPF0057 family)
MSSIIGILILFTIYFIPTAVALRRDNHGAAIFALNLFLGWTVLGWVAALVMALWSNPAGQKAAT